MNDKIKILKKKFNKILHEKDDLKKGLEKKELEAQELQEKLNKLEEGNEKI